MSLEVNSISFPKEKSELVFVDASFQYTWVIYPILLAGPLPKGDINKYDHTIIVYSLEELDPNKDSDLANKVHSITELLKHHTVYIYDRGDYRNVKTFLMCLIRSWFRWNLTSGLENIIREEIYVDSCLYLWCKKSLQLSSQQRLQVGRYRRPLTVLICGDRNSSVCFEEMIVFELKQLPKYSIIVHGGCKGIDLYAAELAALQGLETREYQAEWSLFGKGAGPIRNKTMIENEPVDLILAFHPDISLSSGTKNMMTLGWNAGIPVYIHDLKRKMKFEGDFDVL
jgi:hypothetical protein